MTLLLDDDAIRSASDVRVLIKGIETAVVAESSSQSLVMPARQNLSYNDVFLRVMPVMMGATGILGLKMFHGSMSRGVRYIVILCSMETGEILSILDGEYLTALRTGATSGLATRYLARPDATSVGVIGSGLEAQTNLEAVCAVRDIDRVRVFSPRPFRREAFATEMSTKLGVPVTAAESSEEAVDGSDIIVLATNTGINGPVAFRGAWLEQGQHVVSIGSTTPALREIDVETFCRCDTIVYDISAESMLEESGDVIALADHSSPPTGRLLTLTELLSATHPVERTAENITLFKSVGAALQDMAAALAVYEQARHLGVGIKVPTIAGLKTFD